MLKINKVSPICFHLANILHRKFAAYFSVFSSIYISAILLYKQHSYSNATLLT